MTHSAALTTGLTVNGDDWTRDDLKILARITAGLHDGLEVRGVDYTIPGTAGQVPFGRLAHQRLITATGIVMGVGSTEAEARADFLATRSTMAVQMRGDHDPYVIVAVLEDGSTATISARPLRIEWGPDDLPSYREFLAYWIAVGDPTAEEPIMPDWVIEGGP